MGDNQDQPDFCGPLTRQALSDLYDTYQQPIYRYVYRQVGEMEVARDLTGDVFRRLLQAVQQGNGPQQNARAWLYRTAHNLVIDYYRRQQHRRHLPLHDAVPADGLATWQQADRNLEVARVRQEMQQLTPEQRQVLLLKFVEGLSNEEVADLMEKSVGAVKALQHRALAALSRQLLDKEAVSS